MKIFRRIVICILLILVATSIGLKLCGFQTYSIKTKSMEPNYSVNDLIYVKSVPFEKLSENDVITYITYSNEVSTHRIVSINKSDKSVKTKGDNNEYPDAQSVYAENIVGKVIFKISLIGYISNIFN